MLAVLVWTVFIWAATSFHSANGTHRSHRPGAHDFSGQLASGDVEHERKLLRREAAVDEVGGVQLLQPGTESASTQLEDQQTQPEDQQTQPDDQQKGADGVGTDVSQLDESDPVVCHKEETGKNSAGGSEKTVCTQNGTLVKPWVCKPEVGICCNPRMSQIFYLRCLADACHNLQSDPLCEKHGFCTLECKMNCCCFYTGSWVRMAKTYRKFETKALIIWSAIQGAIVLEADQNFSDNTTLREPPGHKQKWLNEVLYETLCVAFGLPAIGLFVAVFWGQLKKGVAALKERVSPSARKDAKSAEERAEFMKEGDNELKANLAEHVSEKESEGLGGIQQMVITQYSGLSLFKWSLTQSMSLSLHYFLLTDPVQTTVCVLGKTGRLLVVSKMPLNPADEAAAMLRGVGETIILITVITFVWFKLIERTYYLATKYPTEATEQQMQTIGPIAAMISGKTFLFAFGVAAVLWFMNFAFFKLTIKAWGTSETKNFYESDTASCAQYFRTGVKSMPFSKPRRIGGMRIFFGPYPFPEIWWELGTGFHYLKCLEPIKALPVEYDNGGYPSAGGGQPGGPEATAVMLQWVVSLLNSGLGIVGMFFFCVNLYNLLINVNNCPTSLAVQPCVVDGACAGVAKTPWFAHYMVINKLMTQDQLAKESLATVIPIKTVAKWLGVKTVGQAKKVVMKIAASTCGVMYQELIVAPNASLSLVTSDWLGKRRAEFYLQQVRAKDLNVTWNADLYSCSGCVQCVSLWWFADVQNIVELIEIFILGIASYISGMLAAMMANVLENTPMIELQFQADPGAKDKVDVDKTEVECLSMIGAVFFFRYFYSGIPRNMSELETGIRKNRDKHGLDSSKLVDPWQYVDEKFANWDKYELFDKLSTTRFNVHQKLLGFLEGEEAVSAWTVPPQLTTWQKINIFCGIFFLVCCPVLSGLIKNKPLCCLESLIGMLLVWQYIKIFILMRRPQSGIVLTTRRYFQVTRTPRYLTMLGYSEPLIKLDVMIHNCSVFLAQMTMEAHVPAYRKVVFKMLGLPLSRQGQVIAQSWVGIVKMWRVRGDTYNIMNYVSQISDLTPVHTLDPKMGQTLMYQEQKAGDTLPPDPAGSMCCCPYSPPPPTMNDAKTLLERYCKRFRGESDVYGRKLSTRPSRCKDLLCGKGCRLACECCCCCQLDELLTEFIVTTHRILIEQRAVHRYCRCTAMCKKTPNIRVTFLAHNQAAAYVLLMPVKNLTRTRIQQDFSIKLLQSGARSYHQGLMLHQKPYVIVGQRDMPIKHKAWIPHINQIFDLITQKSNFQDDDDDRVSDDSDDDDFYDDLGDDDDGDDGNKKG